MAEKITKKGKSNAQRNANERDRSRKVTNAYSELQNHLPNRGVPFRSKVQILNSAIKRINDLQSILNENGPGQSIDMDSTETCLQGSGDESTEMSVNDADYRYIECIKEDSERMYDMAAYPPQYSTPRYNQSDMYRPECELGNWEQYFFPN